jgi:hypothetical protein
MDTKQNIFEAVQILCTKLTSSSNFAASLSSSFMISLAETSPADEERSSLAGFSAFNFSEIVLEAAASNPLDSY